MHKISLRFAPPYTFDLELSGKFIRVINHLSKECSKNKISIAKTKNNFIRISILFDKIFEKYIKKCAGCERITCKCYECESAEDFDDEIEDEIEDFYDENENEECEICDEYECECISDDYCVECDSTTCICDEEDIFDKFINKKYSITKNKKYMERYNDVYRKFMLYCDKHNQQPLKKKEFSEKLKELGCELKKIDRAWYIIRIQEI